MKAFVGLDGFVDEILHVVDKRDEAPSEFTRMTTIGQLADRLAGAAGRSTNLELVPQVTKLGGNGPIMANALASFGHARHLPGPFGAADAPSCVRQFAPGRGSQPGGAGFDRCPEFEDGKVMVGKHASFKEVTWPNIEDRFGRDRFLAKVKRGAVRGVRELDDAALHERRLGGDPRADLPAVEGPRRRIFFDLADPEKRTVEDIRRALDLIGRFQITLTWSWV
jgi:hypothetical protein